MRTNYQRAAASAPKGQSPTHAAAVYLAGAAGRVPSTELREPVRRRWPGLGALGYRHAAARVIALLPRRGDQA